MKLKYIVFSLFLFISTFSLVNASTIVGRIYTQNQYRDSLYKYSINLFEQTKSHTGIANFIYNHGYNIGNYLNDYFDLHDNDFFTSQYNYDISVLSYGDFEYFLSSISHRFYDGSYYDRNFVINDQIDMIDYLFNNNNIGYSRYHQVYYLPNYSYSDVEYFVSFSFSGVYNNNSFDNSSIGYYNDNFSLSLAPRYLFMFDSAGNPIGYIRFCSQDYCNSINRNGYNYNYLLYLTFTQPFDSNPDMTSWYAYGFKSSDLYVSSNSDVDKIYPQSFYLDSATPTVIQNNAGYSGVGGWFNNLFSSSVEVSQYNISFIYDDVYYLKNSSFKSLWYYWFSSDIVSVPSNYSSYNISKFDKGIYITPKSGCNSSNYLLYFSNEVSVSTYAIYFNYFNKVTNNGVDSLEIYKQVGAYSSLPNTPYSYNPLIELGVTTSELLNYTINIYQYSNKYAYTLYYNLACWDIQPVQSSSISLPFDSGSVTLDTVTLSNNYSNYTVNGVNYVNGSTTPSSGSSNSNVPNSSMLDSNITNVDSMFSNIGGYFSSVYGAITSLVGIATIFLTGLPPIIWDSFIAIFTIGLMIILFKAIR